MGDSKAKANLPRMKLQIMIGLLLVAVAYAAPTTTSSIVPETTMAEVPGDGGRKQETFRKIVGDECYKDNCKDPAKTCRQMRKDGRDKESCVAFFECVQKDCKDIDKGNNAWQCTHKCLKKNHNEASEGAFTCAHDNCFDKKKKK